MPWPTARGSPYGNAALPLASIGLRGASGSVAGLGGGAIGRGARSRLPGPACVQTCTSPSTRVRFAIRRWPFAPRSRSRKVGGDVAPGSPFTQHV
ncbi:hypothetical protein [Sorangium cellulosum]|uniref:Uncharacterized protein n=1 Tax=Sorangium cellulosum So0157-2 TaxID=1254432 RepID=S4YBU1_SORCE|nr:hypothetical protein [Sorangium cellulosum]AGP41830.1 hypothetical protein SCE1572_49475 [Sorangium cellulosum So0157-2]